MSPEEPVPPGAPDADHDLKSNRTLESDRTLDEVREILTGSEQRRQERRFEALEADLAVVTANLDRLSQQMEQLKALLSGKSVKNTSGGENGGSAAASE